MAKPKLSESFAKGLAHAARARGWRAYVPLNLLLCSTGGIAAASAVSARIWNQESGNGLMLYSGVLAFNGILMAIGWSSFSRMYEIIGAGEFSAFLRRNDILEMHILFIDVAQISLVISSIVSGLGLVLVVCPVTNVVQRIALGATITMTCYAITKCFELTQGMHDLIWDSAEFQQQTDSHGHISRVV